MEDTYRREKLTADEIFRRRNSKETTEIIEKIRTEFYDLLANPDESRSELMSKALNYLKNFWNQIFTYRNDGEYSIEYGGGKSDKTNHCPTKEQPVLRKCERNTELRNL